MSNLEKIKTFCDHHFFTMLGKMENWLVKVSEPFSRFMFKLTLIKFAITLAVLLTMVTLFVFKLHVFDPLTIEFSGWATSSLIAFTLSLVIVKFVAVSFFVTYFVLKKETVDSIILRFKELKSLKLNVFLRKSIRLN